MAQTSQIFQNRVMPQITGVNTAVFAQPIQSFKPADLGDALAGEKLELERQKLAIAAEKNRIDMEEAKARVALLENNIKEKRAADNRTYLNMLVKSMGVGDEDANDPTISPDLRRKLITRNKEWHEFIVNATNGDTKLDPKAMEAGASKILAAQANDTEYIQLKRLDNEMKSLVKRAQSNRAIDPTLLNDLTSAYINGQIPPTYRINEQSLMIDENYIKAKDKDLGTILRRYTTEEVEVQDMKGNRYKQIVWKNGLEPEVVYQKALEGIQNDRVLMGYLDNMARRDQLLSQGMYNSIPDREAYRDKLAQSYALSIASENAPKLDWSKVTNPISKRVTIKQEAQAGTVNVNQSTGVSGKAIFTSKLDGRTDLAQANKEGYVVQSGSLSVKRDEALASELDDLGYTLSNSPKMRGKIVEDVLGYGGTGELKLKVYEDQDYQGLGVVKENSSGAEFIAADHVSDWAKQIENGNNGAYKFRNEESMANAYKNTIKLVGAGNSINITTYKDNSGNVTPIIIKPNVLDKYRDNRALSTAINSNKAKRGVDYITIDAYAVNKKKAKPTQNTNKTKVTPPKPTTNKSTKPSTKFDPNTY